MSVPLTWADHSAEDATLATFVHRVHIVLAHLLPQTSRMGISDSNDYPGLGLPSALATVASSSVSPLCTSLRCSSAMLIHHTNDELSSGEGDGDLTTFTHPLPFFRILLDTDSLRSECVPSRGLCNCASTGKSPTLVRAVVN
ncbi:hypothetical protein FS749_007150, partial [Ceratobasidium sp. UAMH 11750]